MRGNRMWKTIQRNKMKIANKSESKQGTVRYTTIVNFIVPYNNRRVGLGFFVILGKFCFVQEALMSCEIT